MTYTDEDLHALARAAAARLQDPDRKQLRFNDIVRVARGFYAADPATGVAELVAACDRGRPDLYVPKAPMWQTLETAYGWMAPE